MRSLNMLSKYKGRIIAIITLIVAVSIWDIIYYGIYKYKYNFLLDSAYTLVLAIVLWWLSSYYDKTKELLTHLSKSEEKYKYLFEKSFYVFNNLNQAVYQIDQQGTITLLNPAWERLTGFSVQESLGQNIYSFLYPDDRQRARIDSCNIVEGKKSDAIGEYRYKRKDGGYIWIETSTKVFYDQNGTPVSAVGALTDITHWKTTENELIQLNENLSIQSEKMAVIAQMSAAIAHEVRNPLTSILGFIQLLKENKHLSDEYIEVIFSEIDRINSVLSEMLLLAKPQANTLNHFDLNHTLNHVMTLTTTEANMKSITISVQTLEKNVSVFGDENRIKQVFINMIKNAIEAMESGGRIDIYLEVQNDFVSIFIKDTGPGIPKEIIGMLGQPFYTSKEKGTGLGLTICFKIIETHKGKIHITSEPGVGSTFEVILPLYQEEEFLIAN
jgi:two-component system, sporulation sensor kinase C